MAKYTKDEKSKAREALEELVQPGDTIYTVLNHVSASGMTRDIDLYVIKDNQPRRISYQVAALLDYGMPKEGVRVGGCGMDMGFHLVYSLGSVLFRESGFTCLGKDANCPANDHSNDYNGFSRSYDEEHAPEDAEWWLTAQQGFRDLGLTEEQEAQRKVYQQAKSDAWKAGEESRWSPSRKHSDPGYALRHRWM